MLNQNPFWKYLLLIAVVAFGLLYGAPNIYGEDPAVQVARDKIAVDVGLLETVQSKLDAAGLSYKSVALEEGQLLARFSDTEQQLRAAETLDEAFRGRNDIIVALNLAPRTPDWLREFGASPMSLGLDLRGGVHLLFEVDMATAEKQAIEDTATELRRSFREERIKVRRVVPVERTLEITMRSGSDPAEAAALIADDFTDLTPVFPQPDDRLVYELSEVFLEEKRKFALQQNIITLRNRVNQLGVAEPLVQQQGKNRIVVQIPGVQDSARIEEILGRTATLEYRAVDTEHDAFQAERLGRAPVGTRLYKHRDGRPVLLDENVIVKGENLIDASSGIDSQSGSPAVFVTLDAKGASRMGKFTAENLKEPMAVVFIEYDAVLKEVKGELVRELVKTEEVISIATIQGVFSKKFQTTGLEPTEAKDLALLLRAGALAAPLYVVEERTVGPSMGQDNINQGLRATVIGFMLVVLFMILYYRGFGIIANFALVLNLVLIVAFMSLLQATLTLPGIAGIVLTVGMAVDANVLIFERIREELRAGAPVQSAIHAGYEKAFATIADANITTLFAAIVLFLMGSGPVKGFAITLSIGILCSMFTAIFCTRVLANMAFGGRKLDKLSI